MMAISLSPHVRAYTQALFLVSIASFLFVPITAADRTLKIWDALSMKELQCFKGHDLAVSDVAWSWDCSRIISASDDTTLRVWDAYEVN